MKSRIKRLFLGALIALAAVFFVSCGGINTKRNEAEVFQLENRNKNISEALIYKNSMQLQYADKFAADYYEEDYILISVADGGRYLVVPKDGEAPEDLDEEIIILKQPLENIYLVATAVMDIFYELDSLDKVRFAGQRAEDWSREEIREYMSKRHILYAGKYNMPDYELILSKGCSLAIENNMISHSPEVVEKLWSIGVPALIDFSSYESHPLGRVEWIKLYGAILNKEKEAAIVFNEQCEIMQRVVNEEKTGKTVAFFFITTNGMVNVRSSYDYVPKMIELAGGSYIFEDLGDKDSNRSSITMQMEEFYNSAREADYLIYNSTIDKELLSIEELLEKSETLKDFKAVREKNVWCTTKDLYQQSMSIGGMIEDMHKMLSEDTKIKEQTLYLYPLS